MMTDLCLQFLCLLPERLYWNLDSASFMLRWYFFILTQERPAASKVHQMVTATLANTHQLPTMRPADEKRASSDKSN